MTEPLVLKEKQGRITVLTLNNPDRRNALSMELVDELYAAVQEIKNDEEVLSVVITGAGKAFSSGGDLKGMMPSRGEGMEEDDIVGGIKDFYKKNLSIMDIPVPTIAAINGHAIGAGCTIALACDMRIASKSAKLALAFVNIGLHPGMGTTYFLPRLVGSAMAYELLMTGSVVTGEEAEKVGLVNHAVEQDQLMASAMSLAEKIAKGPRVPIRQLKNSVRDSFSRNLMEAIDNEARCQLACTKTEDLTEGITAMLERREPKFK